MVKTHNLGFPRIGHKRELKFSLEKYWHGEINETGLDNIAKTLREKHWQLQNTLDLVPVGDFSLYDHILDMSFMLGNIPTRIQENKGSPLEDYFRLARGRGAEQDNSQVTVKAGEMTKWFDTNYHYIVPEFYQTTIFNLSPDALLKQIEQAQAQNLPIKPVIIGPVTYLWLGKTKDNSDRLDLLDQLIKAYSQLFALLFQKGIEWIQIDEPILVTELSSQWEHGLRKAYYQLQSSPVKLLLTTYFGNLKENLKLACELPVTGLHIDTTYDKTEVEKVIDWLPQHKILSLGVINGRNIWKADLNTLLEWLQPIADKLGERLWLAPSCSLLHCPVDLNSETKLDPEIKTWLAFAIQKLTELDILAKALNHGKDSVETELAKNKWAIAQRKSSSRVHNPQVKAKVTAIDKPMEQRHSSYEERNVFQKAKLKLPLYPTTTIGSFPQTSTIRQARKKLRSGEINQQDYQQVMKTEIHYCIQEQETLGLDVLVHGEAERNDMVEYFGEQLQGFVVSQFGWVQSYGSRCVKPPIIYGDINRLQPMTIDWINYAQSLTYKPMKGMLTGPVTLLNWSFVRDDQPKATTCLQLALAIREEVLDLEKAGINIIQIDEAALREGLPLRKSAWQSYLNWAIQAFRISANGVTDHTQIHTHMCYSEFNDIIEAIAAMDADVITIETSRSDMKLLNAFEQFNYPNEIGPGVYDIHSPNIPSVEAIVELMQKASLYIPLERLWVNPDCGLKTRRWEEVKPALTHMVTASKILRQKQQM